MLATVNIDHPKVKNYNQQELEKLIVEVIYNYLDDENNAENDTNLYYVPYDEVPEDVKEKAALLDKMTDEEIEKKYFNFSL